MPALTNQQIQAILTRVQSGEGLEQAIVKLNLRPTPTLLELQKKPGFREQYREAKAQAQL